MQHTVRGTLVRRILVSGLAIALGCMAGCGGGGSSTTASSDSSGSSGTSSSSSSASSSSQTIAAAAPNVATIVVNCGPAAACNSEEPPVNIAYVTVTVCVPGSTTECQTFDDIQVDTQSYGLRLIAGATDENGSTLTIALPSEYQTVASSENQTASNEPLAECAVFADGYSWGPVVTADISISGETTSAGTSTGVPMQIIGSSSYSSVPSDCNTYGLDSPEDTVATFGANGVLGVGAFVQDCGAGCTSYTEGQQPAYYICSTPTNCTDSYAASSQQVSNPVYYFLPDNNGVIVELPPLSPSGAATATGALVFGIGTEDNNGLGSAQVYWADPNYGFITTNFSNQALTASILDSGSNGYFFNDSSDNSLSPCSGSENSTGYFYCPSTTLDFSATITSCLYCATGVTETVPFSVANADNLNPSYFAFNDLAGNLGSGFQLPSGSGYSGVFDWGLPFFFGRNVFTAIYAPDITTPAGDGPYYAF